MSRKQLNDLAKSLAEKYSTEFGCGSIKKSVKRFDSRDSRSTERMKILECNRKSFEKHSVAEKRSSIESVFKPSLLEAVIDGLPFESPNEVIKSLELVQNFVGKLLDFYRLKMAKPMAMSSLSNSDVEVNKAKLDDPETINLANLFKNPNSSDCKNSSEHKVPDESDKKVIENCDSVKQSAAGDSLN